MTNKIKVYDLMKDIKGIEKLQSLQKALDKKQNINLVGTSNWWEAVTSGITIFEENVVFLSVILGDAVKMFDEPEETTYEILRPRERSESKWNYSQLQNVPLNDFRFGDELKISYLNVENLGEVILEVWRSPKSEIVCYHCNHGFIPRDTPMCSNCWKHIDYLTLREKTIKQVKEISCRKCNVLLPVDAEFCHKCGTKLNIVDIQDSVEFQKKTRTSKKKDVSTNKIPITTQEPIVVPTREEKIVSNTNTTITPSEVVLLRGEVFVGEGGWTDPSDVLLNISKKINVAELSKKIIFVAVLANEDVGNIGIEIKTKKKLFGLNSELELFLHYRAQNFMWPETSIENKMCQYLQSGAKQLHSFILSILTTNETPYLGIINVVKKGLASRSLLIEEKIPGFLGNSVKYKLSSHTLGNVGSELVDYSQRLLNNGQQSSTESWLALNREFDAFVRLRNNSD